MKRTKIKKKVKMTPKGAKSTTTVKKGNKKLTVKNKY